MGDSQVTRNVCKFWVCATPIDHFYINEGIQLAFMSPCSLFGTQLFCPLSKGLATSVGKVHFLRELVQSSVHKF